MPISSPNINWFSQFFHWHIFRTIIIINYNKLLLIIIIINNIGLIIKYPTTI